MDAPAGFHTGLVQALEEEPAVGVVLEDRLTAVATAHDMVDRTRILNSNPSGHAESQKGISNSVNTIILGTVFDPFMIFGIVNLNESLVVSPRIIGDRVGLHPLTIIIAVMVGTTLLGGVLGGMLAIPLTAALRALMYRCVWKRA